MPRHGLICSMCDMLRALADKFVEFCTNISLTFDFLVYNFENWSEFEVELIALIYMCCGPVLRILIACWYQFLILLLQKILYMVMIRLLKF